MDAEDAAPPALTVQLDADSERYAADDPRWSEQVGRLIGDLQREVGPVKVVSEPEPGSKGGPEAIILALGSAGAFSMALEVFRAWLARERTRSLSITVSDGDVRRRFTVRGSDLDRDSFRDLTQLAIRQGLRT